MSAAIRRSRRRRLRPDQLLFLLLLGLASLLWEHCTNDASDTKVSPAAVEYSSDDLGPEGSRVDVPAAGKSLRFMMYNVQNYFVAGESRRASYPVSMKSDEAKDAVADCIASVKPDVIGLAEVGGREALKDLSARLKKRGMSYPYAKVLERDGEDRALALLSAHPLAADDSRANYPLYGDHRRQMLRGILDVTVKPEDGRLFRIVGVHLKSRVSEDRAAAASLRRREAETVALYLARLMRSKPGLPVVLFGDFNDGPADSAVRTLGSGTSSSAPMERLNPKDSRGEAWTIYYRPEHVYQTFDHIFVNRALKERLGDRSRSGVVDIPSVRKASDHRPVWTDIR